MNDESESWEALDAKCKEILGFDAVQVALGVFCERLVDPDEDPNSPEHAVLLPRNERTLRLAGILGSSGHGNSRVAAAAILRALDDPRVDVEAFANRAGGIRIPRGFYGRTR